MVEFWTRKADYAWRTSPLSAMKVHYDPTPPLPTLPPINPLWLLGGAVAIGALYFLLMSGDK